jgi:hypothetical protein
VSIVSIVVAQRINGSALLVRNSPGVNIAVTYGRVPDIDSLVPLKMADKYIDGATEIRGEAVYSKFRQFRTSGRLLTPVVGPAVRRFARPIRRLDSLRKVLETS